MKRMHIIRAERIILDAHVVYAPTVIEDTKQALADELIGRALRLGYKFRHAPETFEHRELAFGSAALEVTRVSATLEVEERS
jgi:hypothetical protein